MANVSFNSYDYLQQKHLLHETMVYVLTDSMTRTSSATASSHVQKDDLLSWHKYFAQFAGLRNET